MKIIFLIAPSEWKNFWWNFNSKKLSFDFKNPFEIAENATEKDLKCKWKRFEEWMFLNKNIKKWPFEKAIKRYSWIMYNSINYDWMNDFWKKYFEENFFILSGFYWIVSPLNFIWNYKLPIETKWLYDFWSDKIFNKINEKKPKYVINLLPLSYSKLIWIKNKKINIWDLKIININFLKKDWKKISHWVKKIRWEWIKNICEKIALNPDFNEKKLFELFWWKIEKNWDIFDLDIFLGK